MLELKDGRKYVNKLGEIVTVHECDSNRYPFYSEDIYGYIKTYMSTGFYYDANDPDDLDLVAEYKEPDDIISKAVLTEYSRNRLAVLEVLTESEDIYLAYSSEQSMETLLALCDEFGIV